MPDGQPYSEEEKLQLLAWAYGYPTHIVGDIWSHTLVNEFSNGPWPELANIATYDVSLSNVLRHLMVEGYMADACPGYDGVGKVDDEVERTLLPDGDVSDDSTPQRELNAPIQFIYEAMTNNLPDLPGQKEHILFSLPLAPAEDLAPGTITAGLRQRLQQAVNDQLHAVPDGLSDPLVQFIVSPAATVTVVQADSVWKVKTDYKELVLRKVSGSRLEVSALAKSRGIAVDIVLQLREQLVRVADSLGPPDPSFSEPLAAVVDPILEGGEKLLHGESIVDQDKLFDDLKELGSQIVDSFKGLVERIADNLSNPDGGSPLSDDDLKNLASSFGSSAAAYVSDYLHYWIDNIDTGLQHWSEFGLSLSQALFDPQRVRDQQNQAGRSSGPDAVDPDFRRQAGGQGRGRVSRSDPHRDQRPEPGSADGRLVHLPLFPADAGDSPQSRANWRPGWAASRASWTARSWRPPRNCSATSTRSARYSTGSRTNSKNTPWRSSGSR